MDSYNDRRGGNFCAGRAANTPVIKRPTPSKVDPYLLERPWVDGENVNPPPSPLVTGADARGPGGHRKSAAQTSRFGPLSGGGTSWRFGRRLHFKKRLRMIFVIFLRSDLWISNSSDDGNHRSSPGVCLSSETVISVRGGLPNSSLSPENYTPRLRNFPNPLAN